MKRKFSYRCKLCLDPVYYDENHFASGISEFLHSWRSTLYGDQVDPENDECPYWDQFIPAAEVYKTET